MNFYQWLIAACKTPEGRRPTTKAKPIINRPKISAISLDKMVVFDSLKFVKGLMKSCVITVEHPFIPDDTVDNVPAKAEAIYGRVLLALILPFNP